MWHSVLGFSRVRLPRRDYGFQGCLACLSSINTAVVISVAAALSLASILAVSIKLLPAAALSQFPHPLNWASSMAPSSVEVPWYTPKQTAVNDLTQVFTHTGVYGFLYNSSETPDEIYGIYNWCNMPHVRAREYVKLDEEYQLQYVEVIHRHHKRTPYAANGFPVESYQWNCNDSGLYSYGQLFDGHDAAKVYHEGYASPINPFVASGWTGSCEFPQITAEGLQDSWQHGVDLYGVYHGLLGFLPARSEDFSSKVQYRVTNNLITSQVAGMIINGMWGISGSHPLTVQAKGIDSLEPQYYCPAGANLFDSIQSSDNAAWQNHLERTRDLYDELDSISGVSADDTGFHSSFDHYYDNLSARQCHGKPLPCKLVDGGNSTSCVTQELADTVYRLGQWEYSQIYRDNSSSLAASTSSYGVWIGELADRFRQAIAGTSNVIYSHNVAHDGSISRLLSILQVEEMVWPGMGSEVVFELYRKQAPTHTNDDSYVRVLFGGKTLRSSNPVFGEMEKVPIDIVLTYFDSLVGKEANEVKGKCQGNIPV